MPVLAWDVMSGSGPGSLAHLRRPLALPLAIAAACLLIAACGGAGKTSAKVTAARLVSQAVSASDAVDSGQLSLTVILNLDGIKELDSQPVTLDLTGPFQRDADGQLSADLGATIEVAGTTDKLEVVLLPGHLYLGIGGTFYDLPRNQPQATTGSTGDTGPSGGLLDTLGQRGWLTNLRDLGSADVGGVTTEHVSGDIDVSRVLGAATSAPGSGSTGASGVAGLLPLLAQAITSAKVDVYTGVADHIVRRLHLAVAFTVPALAATALDGLSGGSLDLDATLTDLGRPQTIVAPANSQPRSRLLNGIFYLESRFGALAPLFAGTATGASFGGLFSSGHSATS